MSRRTLGSFAVWVCWSLAVVSHSRPVLAQPSPTAPRALLERALDLEKRGQREEALTAYREALRDAARRDSSLLSDVAYNLGLLHWTENRYDSALVHLQMARDLRLRLGDTLRAARVLNSLGATHYQLGNYEPAIRAFTRALEARRLEGDSADVARVLTNIGKTYHDWRQYERARAVLLEAVTKARSADSPTTLGYALNSLAMLDVDRGDFEAARTAMLASDSAYRLPGVSAADSAGGWALNAAVRGLLLLRTGNARAALPLFDSIRVVGVRRGSARGEARALLHLGETHAVLGNGDAARAAFTRSLELSRSVQQRVLSLEALRHLANAEERAGHALAALRALRAFQALRDTIFDDAAAQRIAAEEADRATAREQEENARLLSAQRDQAAVIARQQLTVLFVLVVLALTGALVAVLVRSNRTLRAREEALGAANDELRRTMSEVRTLSGLIPICANCKNVRDDQGYWRAVESWLASHSDARFSHAICQTCGPELYGELWTGAESKE